MTLLIPLIFLLSVLILESTFVYLLVEAKSSDNVIGSIKELKRSIDALHDKTITITTVNNTLNSTNENQTQLQNTTR